MEQKLKRAHGNYVVGERFWGRDRELELFIESLNEGAHLLLVAQRRMGKTSLMREAARRLEGQYFCIHADLQKARSAADAIVELSVATRPYASLWERTKDIFSNIIDQVSGRIESLQVDEVRVTLRSGLTGGDWQGKGDQLFAALAEADKPVAVFLDEVPLLVNRMLKGSDYKITPERIEQTDAFMSWLRENSIRHKERVRLVVAGSIGLEPILRQAGLSATVNTLTPFELGPWSDATAAGCLEALARQYGVPFQPEALTEVVSRLGVCIPHHVQMFFDHIYQVRKLHGFNQVTTEVVAQVYQERMLSIRGHAELSHMEERLRMVLGPETHPLALELLTTAAVEGLLTPEDAELLCREHRPEDPHRADTLREVLGILEHDGFLLRDDEHAYRFDSRLLKDWWAARFGFVFVRPSARAR